MGRIAVEPVTEGGVSACGAEVEPHDFLGAEVPEVVAAE
jgi:hypothetical protein